MPSTYSTNLALELQATGENSGTWGDITNTNLGTLLEQAISGYVTQAMADADQTITIPNGATGVARNMFIELTGANTGAHDLVVPANKKLYFVYNNCTGGYAITVKVSGQTGVAVAQGRKALLVSNGTDIVAAISGEFASGTRMPFQQTAAPTGWTKVSDAAYNDAALRFVTGSVTPTAGSVAFTTAFAAGLTSGSTSPGVAAHTHTFTSGGQSATHTHAGTTDNGGVDHTHQTYYGAAGGGAVVATASVADTQAGSYATAGASAYLHTHTFTTGNASADHTHSGTTDSSGAGSAHTHTIPSFAVKYVDCIVAQKD